MQLNLVADKGAELPECPVVVSCAVCVPNRGRRTNAGQIFQGTRSLRACGFRNKMLANDVVGIALETALATAELFQSTLHVLGSKTLQGCTSIAVPLTTLFYLFTAMHVAIGINRSVGNV